MLPFSGVVNLLSDFFPVKSAYSKFLLESDSLLIINMFTQNEAIRFQSERAKTSSSARDQIAFQSCAWLV